MFSISLYRAVNTLHLGYKNQAVNLCREVIAVCSQIHIKHAERRLLNVKPGGTYSDHWALEGQRRWLK